MSKPLWIPTHYVLFLCTGNSARSILAEAILNHLATPEGSVRAFSAGSHPKSGIHPLALAILEENHLPTAELRTKNWSEFDQPGAPRMDFVITLCDQAAQEACPIWPGHPVTTHWGLSDPASVTGSADTMRQAFRETYRVLHRRIELFLDMPLGESDPSALKTRLQEIGQL
ncbi:MAG: arsenate reductase ArsC [Gammaproteobacteria bacterium]